MSKVSTRCLLGVVVTALFAMGSIVGTRTTAARLTSTTPTVTPMAFAPPAANLDQVRNGSAASPVSPGNWVNGNLGPQQSHYVEGYSIPYRAVMTNLPTDGTVITLVIGYDIKHSGKQALDYLTHFDRINDPSHMAAFGHGPETINPLIGVAGTVGMDTEPITAPSSAGSPVPGEPTASFNALPAGERVMTLFGGTFQDGSFAYVTQGDLNAAQSETRIQISFTATSATAVLAWGGHIATRLDWGFLPDGEPRSAGGISGSPYHMRLIDWNLNNLGNQDRSLSGAAVFIPCGECSITGSDPVCPGSTNTYTSTIAGACDNPQHSWSITGGGTIIGSTTGASVMVQANNACGSFTLTDTITCEGCSGSPIVCMKTVNVVDTTPPVVTFCPPSATVECPATPVFGTPTFSDNCDTSLTIGFVDSSTPGCDGTGVFTRTTTATDDCGNSISCVQTITIVDTTAPSITCPGPVTVECDADVPAPNTASVTASDACGSVTVTHVGDVASGTCPKTITRTYRATDQCGNSATCTQIITVNDTTPPVLSGCPSDATFQCIGDVPSPATVTANDNCDGPISVQFNETQSNQGSSCNNTITRTWTATDNCGNSASCTQIITVNDTTAPTITCPGPVSVQCIGDVPAADTGSVTASDNCGPVTVTFEGDVSVGTCPTTITRTYKATDACGNMTTCTQTITVNDTTAPVLSGCPSDTSVQCIGDLPNPAAVTANDNCDGAISVDFSETQSNPGSSCNNTVTRTWTATDRCGNSASCTQIITVNDTTAPVLSGCPSDTTVQCIGDVPDPATVTANDNCDGAISVDFSETESNPGSSCNNTITRTWTATDTCGNSASCSQIITVNDTTDPVITCPSDITAGECNNTVTFETQVSDNCDASPAVVCTPPSGTAFPVGTTTVTCTATDDCGNSAECSFDVTIVASPTCTIPLPDPLPTCSSSGNQIQVSVTGGMAPFTFFWTVSGNGTLTAGQGTDTITFDVGPSGDAVVAVTVTDANGCTTECSRRFGCIVHDEFCSLTQGFYGNAGGTFNGVGTLQLIQNLLSSGDLVVGKLGIRSLTIQHAAAACIIQRLPAGGTPTTLPDFGDALLDPTTCQTSPTPLPVDSNGKFDNVLLGQTIALSLNVRLDPDLGGFGLCNTIVTQKALPGPDGLLGTSDDLMDPGPDGLQGTLDDPILTVIIPLPVLEALSNLGLPATVEGLLVLANCALAGEPTGGATLSDINTAVDAINRGFDKCRFIISCTNPVSSLSGAADSHRLIAREALAPQRFSFVMAGIFGQSAAGLMGGRLF